jgi:3-mercaptopyruvate sulfurtransferase SseA
VLRSWTFTPLCASGGCEQVELVRQRQRGTDAIILDLRAPDNYVGQGRFFAPLRCGGRRHARGESVPFAIAVQITNARISAGQAVATQLQATYINPRRVNRTRCVAIPGHDAAAYAGTLS